MRAIILAAGRGARLAPHTDERPKCLVELAGKTLLSRQLAVLAALGIEDIVLVGGYRADQLAAWPHSLVINQDFATTNMVHSLFRAQDALDGGDDVLIAYSDIVYEARVLRALLTAPGDITAANARPLDEALRRRLEHFSLWIRVNDNTGLIDSFAC